MRFSVLLACCAALLSTPNSLVADSKDTSPSICPNRIGVQAGGQRFLIPYCRSAALSNGHDTATRAVIVIQSSSLNASDVYRWMWQAAKIAGAQETTVLFAPQFPVRLDIAAHGLEDNVPVWDDWAWACGSNSLPLSGARATRISSFTVVDQLIEALYDRAKFPRLRTVVVVGQSAGGQFANRYAITNGIHENAARHGIRMRYVAMNSSHYLYLDNRRPASIREFSVVDSSFINVLNGRLPPGEDHHDYSSNDCQNYNKYPKGLDDLWSYPARRSVATIKRDYLARDTRYLVGTLDIYREEPNAKGLSKKCSSDVQGLTRVTRASFYWEHLKLIYSNEIERHQKLVRVPNIGHGSEVMFKHPEGGLKHVFDYDPSRAIQRRVPSRVQPPSLRQRRMRRIPQQIPR